MVVGRVISILVVLAALVLASTAGATPPPQLEGPNGEHQVVVCKYVGTPGVDEELQTGQNPIVVDYHALLGAGFNGTFPFAFSDAQGQSIAVQWTDDVHFSDLSVCPPGDSPVMVDVCDPESGEIISVPEEEAGQYLPVDDPACAEEPPEECPPDTVPVFDRDGNLVDCIGPDEPPTNSTGGSPPGGTTGGDAPVPTGAELPHTGFPVWILLLVAAALLATGGILMRRNRSGA